MPFEISFLALMPHRVKIEPKETRSDGWGTPGYGRGWVRRARVVQGDRRVVNSAGQDVISRTQVYVATASGISDQARITLPSGFVPQQPPIISVKRMPDERGQHHLVIFC